MAAKIKRNNNGEVVEVDFYNTRVTDAGLVHLIGLTSPQGLNSWNSQFTGTGLMRLTFVLRRQGVLPESSQQAPQRSQCPATGRTRGRSRSFSS